MIKNIMIHNSSAPMKYYIETTKKTEKHWHRHLELNYVLSGSLDIQVRENTYQLNIDDIILINPYDIHAVLSENCILAVFIIDLSKFDHQLIHETKTQFLCNSATASDQNIFVPLKKLFALFVKANATDDQYVQLLNHSYSYNIIHYLIKYFRIDDITDNTDFKKQMNRMEKIITYLHQHYKEGLTLKELAERFYITTPYLSKLFKQYLGTNFTNYMNSIRLSYALTEIENTNLSIETLGEKSGFPNTRSFIATFKESYGMTPSRYRKNIIKNEELNKKKPSYTNNRSTTHHNYLETLAKYLESPVEEITSNARVVQLNEIKNISALKKGVPLRHSFKMITSISKAKHILFAKNQQKLKELQQDIGFSYIIFHGILDDDMMVYSENEKGEPELNFSHVDMAIDFLLSINLRPFIQLSFMPKMLAKTLDNRQFYTESVISLPKDFTKWNYLIKNLIIHLQSRYGYYEVEKWLFSLWNIPDSLPHMFSIGTCQDYFYFYKETYETVMSCNPNLTFGGPSCMNNTVEDGEWISEFLNLCKKSHCEPAFLNFHFYPVNVSGGLAKLIQVQSHSTYLKSQNALKESIAKIKNNNKNFDWQMKTFYLTEWNLSISHRDLLNDTVFKATYLIKNILENYDQLDSFGYWVLSDFIEETKLVDDLFHGGLGLFTYNGIKKPAYYAFTLLNKLGSHLIRNGAGYFVTRSNNSIQMILYNYEHFSDLYTEGELFDMTFTERYTAFNELIKKKFVIPITDLQEKNYIIKQTIINRKHGSAFDKWVELGAVHLESQDEIQYLKSVSVPFIKIEKVFPENNSLTISCQLEPHEVRLIEIIPHY